MHQPSPDALTTRSWSNMAADCRNDPTTFPSNSRKYTAVQKPVKITGKKMINSDAKVKSAPRRLTAFVGRLHIDTSEEDLHEYLPAAGIIDVKCKKLAAKDGRTFNTAAFTVSCSDTSRDVFYDESVWPSGSELALVTIPPY